MVGIKDRDLGNQAVTLSSQAEEYAGAFLQDLTEEHQTAREPAKAQLQGIYRTINPRYRRWP
jgi:hypothetical protein